MIGRVKASGENAPNLRFNDDTGNNYTYQFITSRANVAFAQGDDGASHIYVLSSAVVCFFVVVFIY